MDNNLRTVRKDKDAQVATFEGIASLAKDDSVEPGS